MSSTTLHIISFVSLLVILLVVIHTLYPDEVMGYMKIDRFERVRTQVAAMRSETTAPTSPDPKVESMEPLDSNVSSVSVDHSQTSVISPSAVTNTLVDEEKKRDTFIFSKSLMGIQNSEQRARLLNSLYSDLLIESSKSDPYLKAEKASTGCEGRIKGTVKRPELNDGF